MKLKGSSVLLIFVIGVSIIVPFVILGSQVYFPMELVEVLYLCGKLFGLAAFLLISFQYLWTAKLKFLEKIQSYDGRVAAHRTIGFLSILMLGLHPIFILDVYATWGIPFSLSFSMVIGFIALILLLLVSASTFLGRIWRVRYETWKRLHWLTFPVLTLSFFHSMALGSNIYGVVRGLWIGLWSLHLLIFVLKIVHKASRWGKKYKVASVKQIRPGVTELTMDSPNQTYTPGQFGFISLKQGGKWQMWHPFSMTSVPDDKHLTMKVKALGDFSAALAETRPGDEVKIDAGYGAFTARAAPDTRYVMVAGGIGITPLLGILKDLNNVDNPPDIELIYCVHHESDIIDRIELEQKFQAREGWRLRYVVSSQPEWDGETGRLTPERLMHLLDGDLSGTFFLCGPEQLVRTLAKALREEGVEKRRIKLEEFVFLP